MAGEAIVDIRFDSAEELDHWLAANHASSGSVWAVLARTSLPDKHIERDELLALLMKYGWVDSLPRKFDDRHTRLLMSPRKPGSAWSAINKAVAERLIAAGEMHPAGLAVVERSRADGSWTFLDDVEAGILPDDLADALDSRPPARAIFDSFPRSARRGILEWIKQAKRPQTRANRIRETAELAERGERALHWKANRKPR